MHHCAAVLAHPDDKVHLIICEIGKVGETFPQAHVQQLLASGCPVATPDAVYAGGTSLANEPLGVRRGEGDGPRFQLGAAAAEAPGEVSHSSQSVSLPQVDGYLTYLSRRGEIWSQS